jgi:hypothetical protein
MSQTFSMLGAVLGSTLGVAILFWGILETGALSSRWAKHCGNSAAAPIVGLALLAGWISATAEVFSALGCLRAEPLSIAWCSISLALAAWRIKKHQPLLSWIPRMARRAMLLRWGAGVPAFVFTVLVLLVTAFLALYYPPGNWDAQAYQLPRIFHWLAQGSLAPYYTPIERQIRMPPLPSLEWMMIWVLTGSDRGFNLLQWTMGFVALGSLARIARLKGASRSQATIAIVACMSAPMFILQSSSAQSDILVCVHLFAWIEALLISLKAKERRSRWFWVGIAALLFAEGILAKGTFLLFGGVSVATLLMNEFIKGASSRKKRSKERFIRAFVSCTAIVVFGFLAQLPYSARLHKALGPQWPHYETVAPSAWLSGSIHERVGNLVVSLERYSVLPMAPLLMASHELWSDVISLMKRTHQSLGVVEDDPRFVVGEPVLGLEKFSQLHEVFSGNPVQFLSMMIAAAALLFFLLKRRKPGEFILWSVTTGVSGWLGFVVSVKWMVWSNRLIIPAILLGAAGASAWIVGRKPTKLRSYAVTLLFALPALPALFFSVNRPIIAPWGRSWPSLQTDSWIVRMVDFPEIALDFASVLKQLPEDCSEEKPVGVIANDNALEYPLWVGAPIFTGRPIRFEFVSAQATRSDSLCTVLDLSGVFPDNAAPVPKAAN